MILQRLVEYYERMAREGTVAEPGFQSKAIPFLIVLDSTGHFQGIQDTRTENRKSARMFLVPHEIKRSGRNAWQVANLLWDNVGYVLGHSTTDPDKAQKQHESFKQRIIDAFSESPVDVGVAAVLTFLNRGDFEEVYAHPLWPEIAKGGSNITFQLVEDEGCLVCQRSAVQNEVRNALTAEAAAPRQMCLVSGRLETPVRLHTSIKGVADAQSTGANIVSFNLPAFESYRKEQGDNAPVGPFAEFAYTTALNELLSKVSIQRIQIGDATTVFWARRHHPIEEVFPGFFSDSRLAADFQDYAALRSFFTSPQAGIRPFLEDPEHFCVLGLAPNASRLAVRFWYDGTIAEFSRRLLQHFDDLQLVHSPRDSGILPLSMLLRSVAVLGKADNIPPKLAGDIQRAILLGTPYPAPLLTAAIRRIRAERDASFPRVALIKAVLNRLARFSQTESQEVTMALDITNSNSGYRLGRLFAVLERIQEAAQPGINTTIRDRFYGSASSTPVAAFPHLLKLKNHHLAKIENEGLVVFFEKLLAEIMADLADFPVQLDLPDQGRFAIGYYHQRQDFFTKKLKD